MDAARVAFAARKRETFPKSRKVFRGANSPVLQFSKTQCTRILPKKGNEAFPFPRYANIYMWYMGMTIKQIIGGTWVVRSKEIRDPACGEEKMMKTTGMRANTMGKMKTRISRCFRLTRGLFSLNVLLEGAGSSWPVMWWKMSS